ncbi:MAG TPA: alpha/beta family hydrolase [Microbacterium sp.]|uniref:alpha/beta hydrolase family protein n=1 Tax=Microbacterium sp. TaxID=51671 RepID=UPI002B4A3F5C|nr:alpha/beta family hydrolase [Microbacterium sp.]HKT55676.1 alpha/beta family hydrolase [Microbacterium sp.]
MTSTEGTIRVELPAGAVDVDAVWTHARAAWAGYVVTHGAGSRYDSPFLVELGAALAERGVSTLRFNLPYAQLGRRMPGPAAHAVAAWEQALDAAAFADLPVWAGGRSYGGRMASVAAAEGRISPAGLVYLSYPLHPPGRPDRPRVEHLQRIAQRQVFVSGRTDPFVDPHEQLADAAASCPDARIVWVDGDHGYAAKGRKRTAAQIAETIADVVVEALRPDHPA